MKFKVPFDIFTKLAALDHGTDSLFTPNTIGLGEVVIAGLLSASGKPATPEVIDTLGAAVGGIYKIVKGWFKRG